MSYQAHVTDVAYCYDGSFAGFLCCVFESYARREIPAEVCPPEEGQLNFFGARDIPTDPQRARRVAAGLERLGAQVSLLRGDLWDAVVARQYQLIVSNPPYIPDADCLALQAEVMREPPMALKGGRDGCDLY